MLELHPRVESGPIKSEKSSIPAWCQAGASEIMDCRRSLDLLSRSHPAIFKRLFLEEKAIDGSQRILQNVLSPLLAIGLLRHSADGSCNSVVRVSQIGDDVFLVTDLLSCTDVDRVFYICRDESEYLARQVCNGATGRVLDLCTGCGVVAIYLAAKKGKHVSCTGLDVTARSVAYAGFNAVLNGVQDRVRLVQGDLFEPIPAEKYDLIAANPPYIPTPKGYDYFIHSNGGPSGLSIVKKILPQVDRHLVPGGRLKMLTYSAGDASAPILLKWLTDSMPKRAWVLKVSWPKMPAWIFHNPNWRSNPTDVANILSRFHDDEKTKKWKQSFPDRRLTHMHYLLLNLNYLPGRKSQLANLGPLE